jgi:hypothetical protein
MVGGASFAEIINVLNSGDIEKCETTGISKHVQTSSGVYPASISKET